MHVATLCVHRRLELSLIEIQNGLPLIVMDGRCNKHSGMPVVAASELQSGSMFVCVCAAEYKTKVITMKYLLLQLF